MKKSRFFILIMLVLLLALATAVTAFASEHNRNFTASLKGRNEIPARDTNAQGQAIVHFSKDGDSLSYTLIVANIENVLAAHIHCGEANENGPVGVTLFGGGPVTVNGILAQDTVTAPDEGNACGWEELDDVRDAILADAAYVNVHTTQFPPGEIRGQLD